MKTKYNNTTSEMALAFVSTHLFINTISNNTVANAY